MNTAINTISTLSRVQSDAQALVQQADKLAGLQETWFNNEYKRSNQRLYEILASVLGMWQKVASDKDLRIETVRQMKAALTAAGVRVQMNTLALNLFVRYVFRTDRQRALNYTRTLQAAIAAGIEAKDLADFVQRSGGVEECKRKHTKSAAVIDKEQAINNAMSGIEDMLEDMQRKPLAKFKVPADSVAGLHSGYVFVLGKATDKGEVSALAAVPAQSASVTKWAKTKLAQFSIKKAVESEQRQLEQRKSSAIAAAAQCSVVEAQETVGDLVMQ